MKSRLFPFLFIMVSLFTFAQEKINQFDAKGNRNGIWKKYHPNKLLRYEGQFKNGKEIGVFKFYSPATNEFPELVKIFSKESDSAKIEFYNNKGIVESKGLMIEKNRAGKWLYFKDDGKTVIAEEHYVNGVLNGLSKTFYLANKLAEEKNYENGKIEGVLKRYAESGILQNELTYSKGKLNGLSKYYNSNGELIYTGIFENDVKIGDWQYYENGKKVNGNKLKQ